MRLDKFLKVSRIIKRRTLAKEVSDQGRIEINGKEAKASTTVKVGDELTIRLGQRKITARIDRIQETSRKEEAAEMYTILKEEKLGSQDPFKRISIDFDFENCLAPGALRFSCCLGNYKIFACG